MISVMTFSLVYFQYKALRINVTQTEIVCSAEVNLGIKLSFTNLALILCIFQLTFVAHYPFADESI